MKPITGVKQAILIEANITIDPHNERKCSVNCNYLGTTNEGGIYCSLFHADIIHGKRFAWCMWYSGVLSMIEMKDGNLTLHYVNGDKEILE